MPSDLSPAELSYLATTFAVTISKDLDNEAVKVLCSFLVDVVGTLNLITTQRNFLKDENEHEKKSKEQKI